MTSEQFEKSIKLLTEVLEQGDGIVYTGQSITILINHFTGKISTLSDSDLDAVLSQWETKTQDLKKRIQNEAVKQKSYLVEDGHQKYLIRETVIKNIIEDIKDSCPPPPKA
jgi:ABC-type proline/glycine betaine transport system substrate-binding protein